MSAGRVAKATGLRVELVPGEGLANREVPELQRGALDVQSLIFGRGFLTSAGVRGHLGAVQEPRERDSRFCPVAANHAGVVEELFVVDPRQRTWVDPGDAHARCATDRARRLLDQGLVRNVEGKGKDFAKARSMDGHEDVLIEAGQRPRRDVNGARQRLEGIRVAEGKTGDRERVTARRGVASQPIGHVVLETDRGVRSLRFHAAQGNQDHGLVGQGSHSPLKRDSTQCEIAH